MRRMTTLLAATALAGCAVSHTPKDVMETGAQTTHKLKGPPLDAAWCMARNVENWRPSALGATFHPQVRPLAPGAQELIVTAATLDPTVIAVARVMPDGTDSIATLWMTTRPIIQGRDATRDAMLQGC